MTLYNNKPNRGKQRKEGYFNWLIFKVFICFSGVVYFAVQYRYNTCPTIIAQKIST